MFFIIFFYKLKYSKIWIPFNLHLIFYVNFDRQTIYTCKYQKLFIEEILQLNKKNKKQHVKNSFEYPESPYPLTVKMICSLLNEPK